MKITARIFFGMVMAGYFFLPAVLFAESPEPVSSLEVTLPEGEALSLDEATRLALADNLDIQLAQLDQRIKQHEIPIAKAVYDTSLEANATYSLDQQQHSSVVFGDRQQDGLVDLILSKKLPTGTTVTLSADSERHSTNTPFSSLSRNYTSYGKVGVEQPLLRNFFGSIDRAKIRQVRLNVQAFDYQTVDAIEASLYETRREYWDLVFAYENLREKLRAVKIAEEFLNITEKKLELGLVETPDHLAAQANLKKRKLEVENAMTLLYTASFSLKTSLARSEVGLIIPVERPEVLKIDTPFESALESAYQHRRDLKQAELSLEEQRIEKSIRKQERLPELNFDGSYASTGLDRKLANSQGEIFAANHPQYYAGFHLKTNLELRQERYRYKQALLGVEKLQAEIKKLRLQIAKEVDAALRQVRLSEIQVAETKKIEALERQKMKEEEKRFNQGRSSSKTVIDYQEDLIRAETETIQAYVNYEKALEGFYRSQNRLLEITRVLQPSEGAAA